MYNCMNDTRRAIYLDTKFSINFWIHLKKFTMNIYQLGLTVKQQLSYVHWQEILNYVLLPYGFSQLQLQFEFQES